MLRLALVAALAVPSARAAAYVNSSTDYESGALGQGPYQTFKSSSSQPAMWNFNVFPSETPQEGSIFIAPRGTDAVAPGPYIYDAYGDLIWDGSAYGESMSFATYTYQNNTVIALWQGSFNSAGYGSGHGLLLDDTYSVIANISTTVANSTMDFHEFALTDNNTALFTVYVLEQMNLTTWSGPGDGYILVGYMQEVDIATGEALFTWRSLDHVNPSECYAGVGSTGVSATSPWDYFHINAIEKDDSGNYLISSRHCKALYYLDGTDGSIIWRLGGSNSSFTMGANTTFEWQHDARFRDGNTTISLFDNAATSWEQNATESRGMVLTMDYTSMTVELAEQTLPYNASLSESQGSMELQPNSNWLMGWGQEPYLSEYSHDGTMLWSAQFGVGNVQGYRASRGNWTAYPTTTPAMNVTKDDTAATYDIYVSWNGATEISSWELLGSDSDAAKGTSLANVTKTGFETSFTLQQSDVSATYFQARALTASGETLGWTHFFASNGTDAAPATSDETAAVEVTATATFTSASATSSATTGNTSSAAQARVGVPRSGAAAVLGLALTVFIL